MSELAVLIPTLGRAERLLGLLENIHAVTQTPHEVYFIAEKGDPETVKTLLDSSAVLIHGSYGSCAKAMNEGYRISTEPYVFTGNDDLRFHEGWDTAALEALEDGKHVCGTNDGNNRMTCFALVRRSFIESQSGVFDKPDTLWHEYQSQYCDTELADYAQHRGVWTEAPESLTEHLHWEFGKGDRDHPNYVKGRALCEADHRTFVERRKRWLAMQSPEPQASSAPTS